MVNQTARNLIQFQIEYEREARDNERQILEWIEALRKEGTDETLVTRILQGAGRLSGTLLAAKQMTKRSMESELAAWKKLAEYKKGGAV